MKNIASYLLQLLIIRSARSLKTEILDPEIFMGDILNTIWNTSGDPIVYLSHPLSEKWKVFQIDEIKFLSLFDVLENVYFSENKYFTFFDEGALNRSIFKENFSQPFSFTDLKGEQFFDRSVKANSKYCGQVYRYFFGRVDGPQFDRARPFIQRSLVENVHGNMWMSMKGSQMPTHYDNAHNIYIQLFGKKRFRLFPHSATDSLCVHGRLHPHGRQTRFRDLSFPDNLVPPTFSNTYKHDSAVVANNSYFSVDDRDAIVHRLCSLDELQGLEIVLEPGNILSLPPYWYHETKSEEDSVSLSVWLDPTIDNLMKDVYDYPVPFHITWNADQKYHAGFVYMSMLTEEVEKLLNTEHNGITEITADPTEMQDGIEAGSKTLIFFSILSSLRKRYIEDLALDDTDFRESLFGSCSYVNSNVWSDTFTHHKHLQPAIDLSVFRTSAEALAKLLLRTGNAIVPSRRDPRHVAAIVATKAADFVEDFFHYCSHEGGRNLVAIISEWTKCRHEMYMKAKVSNDMCQVT